MLAVARHEKSDSHCCRANFPGPVGTARRRAGRDGSGNGHWTVVAIDVGAMMVVAPLVDGIAAAYIPTPH